MIACTWVCFWRCQNKVKSLFTTEVNGLWSKQVRTGGFTRTVVFSQVFETLSVFSLSVSRVACVSVEHADLELFSYISENLIGVYTIITYHYKNSGSLGYMSK